MTMNEEKKYYSPLNGSELYPTETPGIMYSEHDNILYHVNPNGKIIPLKSPINGGELKQTATPGIMSSQYDDILYHVNPNGKIIPLKSPINGGELEQTEMSGIMYNKYDDSLYHVSSMGEITPLRNPINGANLEAVSSNIFYDETTNQNYTIVSGKLLPITNQEQYDKLSTMDNSKGMTR